jgi:hypothetical protein
VLEKSLFIQSLFSKYFGLKVNLEKADAVWIRVKLIGGSTELLEYGLELAMQVSCQLYFHNKC